LKEGMLLSFGVNNMKRRYWPAYDYNEKEFLIDVYTEAAKWIALCIRRKKGILRVEDGGKYYYCPKCSQLRVFSISHTKESLESLLWITNFGRKYERTYIDVIEVIKDNE
jgi:hypothetical protein